jgi:hypothetical protein
MDIINGIYDINIERIFSNVDKDGSIKFTWDVKTVRTTKPFVNVDDREQEEGLQIDFWASSFRSIFDISQEEPQFLKLV